LSTKKCILRTLPLKGLNEAFFFFFFSTKGLYLFLHKASTRSLFLPTFYKKLASKGSYKKNKNKQTHRHVCEERQVEEKRGAHGMA
jgi:hypothetical protein